MDRLMNPDCWLFVLDYFRFDHHTLLQLMLVDKAMFRFVVPSLYSRPLIDFSIGYRQEAALLKLLGRTYSNLSVHPSPSLLTGSLSSSPTIDYYTLVQEMPSPLYNPLLSNQKSFALHTPSAITAYFKDFGSKIKKMTLSIVQMDYLQNNIEILNQLDTLVLANENPWKDTTNSKECFRKVIQSHQNFFPGKFLNISCLQKTERIWASDPTMMLVLYDTRNSIWNMNSIVLHLSISQNDSLLRILQDVELPKQLKSVIIDENIDEPSSYWDQPLKIFLSRCRVLDHIEFNIMYRPELFSWVFEEQQQQQDVVTGMMAPKDQVQWKSLKVHTTIWWDEYEEQMEHDKALVRTFENYWKHIVVGLGHCLEVLRFEADDDGYISEDKSSPLPVLSLPSTIKMPKLQKLVIGYPSFSKIEYTGVENLRELDLSLDTMYLNGNTEWRDWKKWKSLETLNMGLNWENKVDIWSRQPLNPTRNKEWSTMVESERTDDQKLNIIALQGSDDVFLPALTKVELHDWSLCANQLHWLLFAPNISELEVYGSHNRTEMLDEFFEVAITRSLVFPNLKKIVLHPRHRDDENSIYISYLMGLEPLGIDMFPGLVEIIFGAKIINKLKHLHSKALHP